MFSLTTSFRIEQVQIQAMECSVCKQLIGRSQESSTEVSFRGGSIYALCACCGQAVKPKWSMAYMKRHDAWRQKLRQEGEV